MSTRSRSVPWYRIPGERYARECAAVRAVEDEDGRNRGFRHGAWRHLAVWYAWQHWVPLATAGEHVYSNIFGQERSR